MHLYGGTETTLPVAGGKVTLTETSTYPWDGAVSISRRAAGLRRLYPGAAGAGLGATAPRRGSTAPSADGATSAAT